MQFNSWPGKSWTIIEVVGMGDVKEGDHPVFTSSSIPDHLVLDITCNHPTPTHGRAWAATDCEKTGTGEKVKGSAPASFEITSYKENGKERLKCEFSSSIPTPTQLDHASSGGSWTAEEGNKGDPTKPPDPNGRPKPRPRSRPAW